MSTEDIVTFLKELLCREKRTERPLVGKISIALGIVEDFIIRGKVLPCGLELNRMVEDHYKTLQEKSRQIDFGQHLDTRAKITCLANFVWSHLRSSKKDIIHAQHLYSFTQSLKEGKKTQLCCAGVTMTVLSLAQCLVGEHEDFRNLQFVITEDHCLLSLTGSRAREDLAEVTTESLKARGQVPQEDAFSCSWLYSGGRPLVCNHIQALVASVVSMNYNIRSKKEVSDSLFAIQQELLEHLFENVFPMYPNAIASMATMKEESKWHDIESSCTTLTEALQEFDGSWKPIRDLYRVAIESTSANEWYPSSCLATSYSYEHELLQMCYKENPSVELGDRLCSCLYDFMDTVRKGSEVFVKFRYAANHDEELLKDVDDVISKMKMMFQNTEKLEQSNHSVLCQDLVKTFDNLLVLFSGKTLPSTWSKCFFTALHRFSQKEREESILKMHFSSTTLSDSKDAMIECKKSVVLQILDTPGLELGQDSQGRRKRQRSLH